MPVVVTHKTLGTVVILVAGFINFHGNAMTVIAALKIAVNCLTFRGAGTGVATGAAKDFLTYSTLQNKIAVLITGKGKVPGQT